MSGFLERPEDARALLNAQANVTHARRKLRLMEADERTYDDDLAIARQDVTDYERDYKALRVKVHASERARAHTRKPPTASQVEKARLVLDERLERAERSAQGGRNVWGPYDRARKSYERLRQERESTPRSAGAYQ